MEFYMKDIINVTGIKRERLKEWIKRGYISPSIRRATRPRERNIFSHNDLYLVAIFKELVRAGFSRRKVSGIMNVAFPNILEAEVNTVKAKITRNTEITIDIKSIKDELVNKLRGRL